MAEHRIMQQTGCAVPAARLFEIFAQSKILQRLATGEVQERTTEPVQLADDQRVGLVRSQLHQRINEQVAMRVETMGLEPTTPCLQSKIPRKPDQVLHERQHT